MTMLSDHELAAALRDAGYGVVTVDMVALARVGADAAETAERDECQRDLWERVVCTGRELDVVRMCRLAINTRRTPMAKHLVDVRAFRRARNKGNSDPLKAALIKGPRSEVTGV